MNNYISKGRRCLLAKWKVYGSLEQTEIASTRGNEDNLKVKIVFEPFQPSSIFAFRTLPWKSSLLWGVLLPLMQCVLGMGVQEAGTRVGKMGGRH